MREKPYTDRKGLRKGISNIRLRIYAEPGLKGIGVVLSLELFHEKLRKDGHLLESMAFLFFLELFHEKLRKGVFRSLNGSFAWLCDAQVSFHIYIGNEHTFPRSEIELAGAPPYAW